MEKQLVHFSELKKRTDAPDWWSFVRHLTGGFLGTYHTFTFSYTVFYCKTRVL